MQCRSRLDWNCSAAQDTFVEELMMRTTKPGCTVPVCDLSISGCVLL